MYIFGQCKDHNSGRKHGNETNDLMFLSTFPALTVIFIFVFKNSQNSFSFPLSTLLVQFSLQSCSILGTSYRLGQPIILFKKIDTLRLLKIYITFCPLREPKKGISSCVMVRLMLYLLTVTRNCVVIKIGLSHWVCMVFLTLIPERSYFRPSATLVKIL